MIDTWIDKHKDALLPICQAITAALVLTLAGLAIYSSDWSGLVLMVVVLGGVLVAARNRS
jgi:hypothetical protein